MVSNWGPTIYDQKARLKNLFTKEFPFCQNHPYCSMRIKKKSDSYHNSRHLLWMASLWCCFFRICISNAHISIFILHIIEIIYHIFYLFSYNWSLVYFTLSLITCSQSLSDDIFWFNFKVSSFVLISLKTLFTIKSLGILNREV